MSDGYTNTKARPHVAPEYLRKGREKRGRKKEEKERMLCVYSYFLLSFPPAKPVKNLDEY